MFYNLVGAQGTFGDDYPGADGDGVEGNSETVFQCKRRYFANTVNVCLGTECPKMVRVSAGYYIFKQNLSKFEAILRDILSVKEGIGRR